MGILFGNCEGSWTLESDIDPRWNCHGYGFVGGLTCPPDAEKKIKELKKTLGEPPSDTHI